MYVEIDWSNIVHGFGPNAFNSVPDATYVPFPYAYPDNAVEAVVIGPGG
jgi:hypothetical protein